MVIETQELDDRWILPLRGSRVTSVDLGENVTIVLDSGVRIIVGYGAYLSQGSIHAPDVDLRTIADGGTDVVPHWVGSQVASAVGFKSGALRVVLRNGWHLNVKAEPDPYVPAVVIDHDAVLWARVAPRTEP